MIKSEKSQKFAVANSLVDGGPGFGGRCFLPFFDDRGFLADLAYDVKCRFLVITYDS